MKRALSASAVFLLTLIFICRTADAVDESSILRVRIAECYSSPQAQLMFVLLGHSMNAMSDMPPVWQTLPSSSEQERYDLTRASVIGAYDMLFSGNGEHIANLQSQNLLRDSRPFFSERLILVGPPDRLPEVRKLTSNLETPEVLKVIFSGEFLFFNPYKDFWIDESLKTLLKQADVSRPESNRQYVETGRDGIEALILAGDEGGFILTGEAAFAQYEEFQRHERNLIEVWSTDIERVSHVALVTNAGYRKERTRAADRYFEWLASEEGKNIVENFEIAGIRPFHPIK